jgi:hypothetical protein
MRSIAARARYVNLPEVRNQEDYQAASDEIEGLLRQLPGFVALYRLGSIGHPGISDLDRIAVVEARDPVPSIWPHLTPGARYVAMHGPFLVDVDTFRSHRWFTHLAGLELAAGEAVPIDEPSDPATCDLHLAAEGLALLALKLVQQARTGRVKVRSTLCQFHAMRFSLLLAGLDERSAPEAWSFVHAVWATRQTWFERSEQARPAVMAGLMDSAPAAFLDALLALDRRPTEGSVVPEGSTVPLRSPWSSVTLVGCDEGSMPATYAAAVRPPPESALIGRSRRLGALRWRTASERLPMPPRVLGLLTETREGATELHRKRHRIIAAYGRFLATRGQGFSPIGLGGPFT